MTAPRCLCLAGPTASGKTAAALAVADAFAAAARPVEIVSVDSALVYRGMDIGTAKPSAAERARVPHHLIDLIDPRESYSAARFVADATRLIGEIAAVEDRIVHLKLGENVKVRVLKSAIAGLEGSAEPEVVK